MQIIVLGMHRSGTSALTKVLGLLGCHLGETTEDQSVFEEGYFELRRVMALNDELLAQAGGTWFDIDAAAFAGALPSIGADFDARARDIIQGMDERGRPWVLKDPRLCITLPFWQRHIESPIYILTHRNPIESALSLKTRDGMPLPVGCALWAAYATSALYHSAGGPRVCVRHSELVNASLATAERLMLELERMGARGLSLDQRDAIAEFISPAKYRHQAPTTAQDALLSATHAELARTLENGTFPDVLDPSKQPTYPREVLSVWRAAVDGAKATAEVANLRFAVEVLREKNNRREWQTAQMADALRREELAHRDLIAAHQQLRREANLKMQVAGHVRKYLTKQLLKRHQSVNNLLPTLNELEQLSRWAARNLVREVGAQEFQSQPLQQLHILAKKVKRWGESLARAAAVDPIPPAEPLAEELPVPAGEVAAHVLRRFKRLVPPWKTEERELTRQLTATSGLIPSATPLRVRVATMYAGEAEYEDCKRAVTKQSHPPIEHVFIENLPEKEATSTLMEGFLASDADVLIKLDADMVLLDEHFVQRVAHIFAVNPVVHVLQMAILDFFSADLMQGINAYRQGFPWRTEQQDPLFTDRVGVDAGRRLITWTTFADAAVHCPAPLPFQAFHFGVHRGLKVVQADREVPDRDSANEQLVYLEKTYEHFRAVRDPRLGFAVLGFELALTEKIPIDELTYANPALRERFRHFESWDVDHIEQEIESRRTSRGVSEVIDTIRGERRRLLQEQTAPVKRLVSLIPHLDMFGGVNRFFDLSRALRRSGLDAVVAVPDRELQGSKRPREREDYADVPILPLSEALAEDWDVVLCGDCTSGMMLTMPLFRTRLCVVYLLNGWTYRLFNTRQIEAVRPDVIVANSSYSARHYADLAPSIVAGGVDLSVLSPAPQLAPRAELLKIGSYPGRGRECKRFQDTLAACRVLVERGVPVELHIFDRTAMTLEEPFPLVHHGALGRIEIPKFMQSLHVFVSAEEDAGWSNPAAEAMACGVPLVCTEAGSTDFAIHERTALVVPARDPEALADAVQRLWQEPELAQRLRDAGLERIREHDWPHVAERLLELLRRARKDARARSKANDRAKRNLAALGVA